ncbi:LuxR C-terminal-related transcriptional regulator [Arthrobacter sp. K5]|uniref:LuxR C-terminal-related transcriptional regulator n=1 Tax=Arthrobacter sp. K5 TaxID=2839623 RepID=A0AAU8ESS6_9MICC
MERNDAQYRTWLELVGDILQQPADASMRHEEQLLDLLTESFNGACTTRNWVSQKWQDHVIACWPWDYLPVGPPGDFTVDATTQPLLRWYALTDQAKPQSLGRVPAAVAGNRLKQEWDDIVRPWGVSKELAIPAQMEDSDHSAYVISRPDRDFTDQELDLAFLLQPILAGLARHLALASITDNTSVPASDCRLTVREVSIVTLLSSGLTAQSLARRLRISPRTAEKHLENIYRKLDVGDRLMAVRRAYEMGLLTPPAASIQLNCSGHPPGGLR